MKFAAFNATCPYEIGDKIVIRHIDPVCAIPSIATRDEVRTITDISCTHYLKTGKIEFRYELDNSGEYIDILPPGTLRKIVKEF